MADLSSEYQAGRHRAKLYYLCNFKPNDRLLDIGCGYGQLIYWASQICQSVVGIDMDEGRRRDYEKYAYPELKKKIDYRLMNIDDFEPREKFTIITMMDVIEHLYPHQLDALLPKIYNSLEHKGRFVTFTPSLHHELVPLNSLDPYVIPDDMRGKIARLPVGHVAHYSLRGLMEKFAKNKLVVTAAFMGTKCKYELLDDIRTPYLEELGLHIIARRLV